MRRSINWNAAMRDLKNDRAEQADRSVRVAQAGKTAMGAGAAQFYVWVVTMDGKVWHHKQKGLSAEIADNLVRNVRAAQQINLENWGPSK